MYDVNTNRKNIHSLFSERGVNFLIPDYQRNYSWGREYCEQLWTDFEDFALHDENFDDDRDEYFLGTILVVNNDYRQKEVIDGQQRLITLMLLLRAFYENLGDNVSSPLCYKISECLWKMKNNDTPDKTQLKITSCVITDEYTEEFKKIIIDGESTKGNKSKYAENYRFFQRKISEAKQALNPEKFFDFLRRILNNCMLLLIETEKQSTAFRIFTTLNDRGMPLSDSDIFKAQFYKFFNKSQQKKDKFIRQWKELENLCNKNFRPRRGTSTDDLFRHYMYYLLTEKEIYKEKLISDTFKGLRLFYEQDNYAILHSEKTFSDLQILADFWNDISNLNRERFSEQILKKLYILKFCPFGIWAYVVSLYFMSNKDSQDLLEENSFCRFLNKITAMFLMHAITNTGVQNIRRLFIVEFKNIFHGRELSFKDYRQDRKFFREQLKNFKFTKSKPITRAMLTWYVFKNDEQKLPPLDTTLDIEHIYAIKRNEFQPLSDEENLEKLGNKSLLEKRINIRAADYRFTDKKKFYLGYRANNEYVKGTNILELRQLAENKNDFTEEDILERNEKIFSAFMKYLDENNLLK